MDVDGAAAPAAAPAPSQAAGGQAAESDVEARVRAPVRDALLRNLTGEMATHSRSEVRTAVFLMCGDIESLFCLRDLIIVSRCGAEGPSPTPASTVS